MRRTFAKALYHQMTLNQDIYLITADLGFGLWDEIREAYPKRFYNVGASEMAAADICVGLALSGKIPFFYSITPFLLYRCFETLRTYYDYEKIPVRLVGSGRDDDYKTEGYSHDARDARDILSTLKNIQQLWPESNDEIPTLVSGMCAINAPTFISLRK